MTRREITTQLCVIGNYLLECVHQPRDGAIQVFVGPPHLFDLVDRVQHRGVVLSAELPANFRKRSSRQLFHDVHRHLARKRNRASIAPDLQILLAQIEMLADALLNQVNRDTLLLRSNDVAENLLGGRQ